MTSKFLIAEYCPGPLFMGWHLYLRDTNVPGQRNAEGDWGWLERGPLVPAALRLLVDLGIRSVGDNSTDAGAYAELARRHPAPGQIGGKPRGKLPVVVDGFSIRVAT